IFRSFGKMPHRVDAGERILHPLGLVADDAGYPLRNAFEEDLGYRQDLDLRAVGEERDVHLAAGHILLEENRLPREPLGERGATVERGLAGMADRVSFESDR